MLTEKVLTNIVVAWIEAELDKHKCFAGSKVIRAGEDAPEPSAAHKAGERATDGSSLFVTVDLTNDQAISNDPLYCDLGIVDGHIERTRNVIREVAFSINAYRCEPYDAARILQSSLEHPQAKANYFGTHNMSVDRYDTIARLREVIHDQWEHRTQFGVYFRYVDCQLESDCIMEAACVNDEIIACEEEPEDEPVC